MQRFNFYNPVKIVFNTTLESAAAQMPKEKVLLVTSKHFADLNFLKEAPVAKITNIPPNPQRQDLESYLKTLPDFENIVALGGGSVIDSAKFLSQKTNAKIFAIPTTHGSSSELTPWATIWDFANLQKHSIQSTALFPKTAFYVPALFQELPLKLSISCTLDAFSHAAESVLNKNANPISTLLAQKAMALILEFLPQLPQNLNNAELRSKLIEASIFSGLAFSNTATALAHALSYPLTLKFNIPHGLAAVFSLPSMFKTLEDGEKRDLLQPLLPKLEAVFAQFHVKEDLAFLTADDIGALFENLNERAKNSVLDVEKVKAQLLKDFPR